MNQAQTLNGKKVVYPIESEGAEIEDGKIMYTFADGSKAYILTQFEDCEPYMTASLSTSSKLGVKYWKLYESENNIT